jgi:hypothetical protein
LRAKLAGYIHPMASHKIFGGTFAQSWKAENALPDNAVTWQSNFLIPRLASIF